MRSFAEKQAGFWGDCASMRCFAQKSSGVLGGLCFYEKFSRREASGILGELCFYEIFRAEKQRDFGVTVLP